MKPPWQRTCSSGGVRGRGGAPLLAALSLALSCCALLLLGALRGGAAAAADAASLLPSRNPARKLLAKDLGFSFDQPDPIAEFGGGATIGLSLGVAATVCVSGLMSGLTLGLLSLDRLDLEVMLRTGSDVERRMAARLAPIVKYPHWVLATLVIINTVSSVALPLCMDRLVSSFVALIVSSTAIVLFGEIIPQVCMVMAWVGVCVWVWQHACMGVGWGMCARAKRSSGGGGCGLRICLLNEFPFSPPSLSLVQTTAATNPGRPQAVCSRHGLAIGGTMAPMVRALMWLTAPLSWPIGWLLDWLLGSKGGVFGRRQLMALVDLHRTSTGMGGPLNDDEFNVILGVRAAGANEAGLNGVGGGRDGGGREEKGCAAARRSGPSLESAQTRNKTQTTTHNYNTRPQKHHARPST